MRQNVTLASKCKVLPVGKAGSLLTSVLDLVGEMPPIRDEPLGHMDYGNHNMTSICSSLLVQNRRDRRRSGSYREFRHRPPFGNVRAQGRVDPIELKSNTH